VTPRRTSRSPSIVTKPMFVFHWPVGVREAEPVGRVLALRLDLPQHCNPLGLGCEGGRARPELRERVSQAHVADDCEVVVRSRAQAKPVLRRYIATSVQQDLVGKLPAIPRRTRGAGEWASGPRTSATTFPFLGYRHQHTAANWLQSGIPEPGFWNTGRVSEKKKKKISQGSANDGLCSCQGRGSKPAITFARYGTCKHTKVLPEHHH